MGEFIHLIGAEEVAQAGYNMRSAAEDMQRAAMSVDENLTRIQFFMNDWLDRLAVVLKEGTS